MLKFMVIGAPRSGTAWAANWLSAEGRLCLHDPLWDHHYDDLDDLPHVQGIACTGIAYFPEWVNAHKCPKVILHRDKADIDCSLAQMGLPEVPQRLVDNLELCRGLHVPWHYLFSSKTAFQINLFLKLGAFDAQRFEMLRHMKVTSNWPQRKAHANPAALARFRLESYEALS
jgi:hypothetical protein